MSDDRLDEERLGEALLAEENRGRESARRGERPADAWLEAMLDREEAAERRVRRLAVGSWQTVVALVPLFAIAILMIRVVTDGWLRDAVRAGVLVLGIFALLAIFVALLATVAWLLRSRSVSLAAVERRLTILEELLRRGGR